MSLRRSRSGGIEIVMRFNRYSRSSRKFGEPDLHERSAATSAVAMQRLGDQLLAGSAFAGDQNSRVRRSDARDELENANDFRIRPDDVREVELLIEIGTARRLRSGISCFD